MERTTEASSQTSENSEPPVKKIKSEPELVELITKYYELGSKSCLDGVEKPDSLKSGLREIRSHLEKATSSRDVSFGSTRTSAKLNWAKCLELMLEDEPESLTAVKILTEKLNPGGGLL